MNDWHLANLGQFAMSGPGLVIIEATGVEAAGRITHGCSGLYSDDNEAAMKRVVDFCKSVGQSKIGVQLGHAGRKASSQRPWEGGNALSQDVWQTYAPSAIPFADGWHTPEALDDAGLTRIKQAFVDSAKRAVRLGIDAIELHAAHGYLIDQFLNQSTNHRDDMYGGSLENRCRLLFEVTATLIDVMGKGRVGVRLSPYLNDPQTGTPSATSLLGTSSPRPTLCSMRKTRPLTLVPTTRYPTTCLPSHLLNRPLPQHRPPPTFPPGARNL